MSHIEQEGQPEKHNSSRLRRTVGALGLTGAVLATPFAENYLAHRLERTTITQDTEDSSTPVEDTISLLNQTAGETLPKTVVDAGLCPESYANLYEKASLAELKQTVASTEFFFDDPGAIAQLYDMIQSGSDQTEVQQIVDNAFASRGVKLHFFEPISDSIKSDHPALDLATLKIAYTDMVRSFAFMPKAYVTVKKIFLANGMVNQEGKGVAGLAWAHEIAFDIGQFKDPTSSRGLHVVAHELYHIKDRADCEGEFHEGLQDPTFTNLYNLGKTPYPVDYPSQYGATSSGEDKPELAASLFTDGLTPKILENGSDLLEKEKQLIARRLSAMTGTDFGKIAQFISLFPPERRLQPPKVLLEFGVSPLDGIGSFNVRSQQDGWASSISAEFTMPDQTVEHTTLLTTNDHQFILRLRQVGSLSPEDLTSIAKQVLIKVNGGTNFKLTVNQGVDSDGVTNFDYQTAPLNTTG